MTMLLRVALPKLAKSQTKTDRRNGDASGKGALMKRQHSEPRLDHLLLLTTAFLTGVLVQLGGCKRYDEAVWTEEVKLHDGRVIEVWRRATRQPSGFPVAPRGRELEVELRSSDLNISWTGDGTSQPLSLDLFEGVPHLVLLTRNEAHCKGKDGDELRAQFLAWKHGNLHEIDKNAYPLDKGIKNLYTNYWGHSPADDARKISWKTKATRDGFFADAPYTIRSWYAKTANYCRLYK